MMTSETAQSYSNYCTKHNVFYTGHLEDCPYCQVDSDIRFIQPLTLHVSKRTVCAKHNVLTLPRLECSACVREQRDKLLEACEAIGSLFVELAAFDFPDSETEREFWLADQLLSDVLRAAGEGSK